MLELFLIFCRPYCTHQNQLIAQNQFMLWANAPGLIISVWLNLQAAKLQYCDRMSANMRSSFVNLLDSNRRSFAMRTTERGVALGGDLDKWEDNIEATENGDSTPIQNFTNLRKMALDITLQKVEAPAPHEKIVVGGKE